MKILILMMVFLQVYQIVKAQTWSEWFDQNQTQLKYLQEQIAALQLLNNTQQTGYFVSETGLMEIDSTGEEDFMQHDVFFERLAIPNETILHDPRIREISNLCERCGLIANAISSLDALPIIKSTDWTDFCAHSAQEIENGANDLAERLYDIIVPQQTQMSDAQREQAIGELWASARKLYQNAIYRFQSLTAQPTMR